MEEAIFKALTLYYGLDWLAFVSGMTGMFLLTRKIRLGFVFSGLACLCGVTVAAMSMQIAYVVYNAILAAMMLNGFSRWKAEPAPVRVRASTPDKISAWTRRARF